MSQPDAETFDPGATLCGHSNRTQRAHYLGGGLWVCFECFARLLLGDRAAKISASDQEPVERQEAETAMPPTVTRGAP